jgi:hypothetical protein
VRAVFDSVFSFISVGSSKDGEIIFSFLSLVIFTVQSTKILCGELVLSVVNVCIHQRNERREIG